VILPDLQTGGSLLLVQDLTRVRRLEKVRRDFISNISHELRTPLASLKALTETLRDGALADPKAAPRFLERIEIEVDVLTQMAQELLDLTLIESGQVPLDLVSVSPSKLLVSAVDRMHAQAERAGLILKVNDCSDLPPVLADAARLEQVLVNLIHNALKFTEPGGHVELSASVETPFIRFAVQDSGVGIPQDELERVFERFYKADRARSGGGTGLGLSITRHIVEAHRGLIWVESIEGRGSTFYFTIPVA
jgi:two-component system phosphate regulon sensor histidine kinase PhoR